MCSFRKEKEGKRRNWPPSDPEELELVQGEKGPEDNPKEKANAHENKETLFMRCPSTVSKD